MLEPKGDRTEAGAKRNSSPWSREVVFSRSDRLRPAPWCVVVLALLLGCGAGCGKSNADRLEQASTKIASWMGTLVLVDKASGRSEVSARFASDALDQAERGIAEQRRAVAKAGGAGLPDFQEAETLVAQSRSALARSDRPVLLRLSLRAERVRDRILASRDRS